MEGMSYDAHDAYKYMGPPHDPGHKRQHQRHHTQHQHPYQKQGHAPPDVGMSPAQQSIQHELTTVSQDNVGVIEHQRSMASLIKLQAMDECEERWMGRAAGWQEEVQQSVEHNTALKGELTKAQEKIHRLEDKLLKALAESQATRDHLGQATKKAESLEALLAAEKEKCFKQASTLEVEKSSFDAKLAAMEMHRNQAVKELEQLSASYSELKAMADRPTGPSHELLEAMSRAEKAEALVQKMTDDLRDRQNTSDQQNTSIMEIERSRWEERHQLTLENQTLTMKIEGMQSFLDKAELDNEKEAEHGRRAVEEMKQQLHEMRDRERGLEGQVVHAKAESDELRSKVQTLQMQTDDLRSKALEAQARAQAQPKPKPRPRAFDEDVQHKVAMLSGEIQSLQKELSDEKARAGEGRVWVERAQTLEFEVRMLKDENNTLRLRAEAQRAVSPPPPPPKPVQAVTLPLPMQHDITGLAERNKTLNTDIENLQERHIRLQQQHETLQEAKRRASQELAEWKYKALLCKPTTMRCTSCGAKNTVWPDREDSRDEARGHRHRHTCKHRLPSYTSDCTD